MNGVKAIIEIEITGDFGEPLSNEDIIELLNDVIIDGAKANCLDSSYQLIKMLKEESE